MLPFRGKKNLASALRGVNEGRLPTARLYARTVAKAVCSIQSLTVFGGFAQPQNALKLVVVTAVGV